MIWNICQSTTLVHFSKLWLSKGVLPPFQLTLQHWEMTCCFKSSLQRLGALGNVLILAFSAEKAWAEWAQRLPVHLYKWFLCGCVEIHWEVVRKKACMTFPFTRLLLQIKQSDLLSVLSVQDWTSLWTMTLEIRGNHARTIHMYLLWGLHML